MGLETSAFRFTASTQAVICARIWKVTWRWRQTSFETSVRLHGVGFESSAFRMESEHRMVGGPPGKRCGLEKGAEDRALRSPLSWNVIWLVGASPSATR